MAWIQDRLLGSALAFTLSVAALPAFAAPAGFRVEIIAPEQLANVLEANLDIVSWAERENVTEEQLRQLVRTAPEQARALLATEGYFSAKVDSRLKLEEEKWIAELNVEPGQPTLVDSLTFEVLGEIAGDPERESRIAQARSAFTLNKGAVFRQADWQASKDGATHSLHRRHYAAARVTNSRAEIDPASQKARLTVEIDSGPPFFFGDVQVTGLERYDTEFVRNLSPVKAGDAYDEEALLKFQRRLLTNGRFASAVVWADNDVASASATPIRVSLVESAARTVELGVGYSTDRGPRFQASYTDRHTLDRAWLFDSRLKLDRLSTEIVGGLTFPVNTRGWHYGLEGKYDEQDIQGERRINWSTTGVHAFKVEEYESRQSLQLLTENRLLEDGAEDNRVALFLAQDWRWDRLDNILAPREGYFFGLQVGGASRAVVSDRSFGRIVAKASYLQPIGSFGTLAFRVEGGAVIADSRENIPSAYLFRTGGDTTIRGYAFESIGVAEGGAVVGGRYLAVGSIEYIQWLSQQWGAAIFYDVGNASDDTSPFETVAGYGVGARWHSPIGALSLDLAYGDDLDEYRLHFTAGFVFR